MQITLIYLRWPEFSTLAGPNFEDRYWDLEGEHGKIPGEVEIDSSENMSDSFHTFHETSEFLAASVEADSPWRSFVDHAFTAIADGTPKPRNDMDCEIDPELYAAIHSPKSVGNVVAPIIDQTVPWAAAPPDVKEEADRIHRIWTKAAERDLGVAYHLG